MPAVTGTIAAVKLGSKLGAKFFGPRVRTDFDPCWGPDHANQEGFGATLRNEIGGGLGGVTRGEKIELYKMWYRRCSQLMNSRNLVSNSDADRAGRAFSQARTDAVTEVREALASGHARPASPVSSSTRDGNTTAPGFSGDARPLGATPMLAGLSGGGNNMFMLLAVAGVALIGFKSFRG